MLNLKTSFCLTFQQYSPNPEKLYHKRIQNIRFVTLHIPQQAYLRLLIKFSAPGKGAWVWRWNVSQGARKAGYLSARRKGREKNEGAGFLLGLVHQTNVHLQA